MTWINTSSTISPVVINPNYLDNSKNPSDISMSNNKETITTSLYKYLQYNITTYTPSATSNIITVSYNNNLSKYFYDAYNVYIKTNGVFIRDNVDVGVVSINNSLTRSYANLTGITNRSMVFYRVT